MLSEGDAGSGLSRSMPVERDPSDSEMFAALGRLLSPDSFVVDVGANEGQFIHELRRVVPVRAVCLEPGSDAFRRLHRSVDDIDGIQALNIAASPISASAEFFISSSDVGSSLLRPVPGQRSNWAQTVQVENVRTARLDELMQSEAWPHIDLLKVDTQGSDFDVLESAGERLAGDSIGAVLVEVNFHEFYVGQQPFSRICRLMESRNYFLGELFRRYNRHGWLWYADALFLPRTPRFAT